MAEWKIAENGSNLGYSIIEEYDTEPLALCVSFKVVEESYMGYRPVPWTSRGKSHSSNLGAHSKAELQSKSCSALNNAAELTEQCTVNAHLAS